MAATGSAFNTSKWSVPLYIAQSSQATVQVQLAPNKKGIVNADLQNAFNAVPIPAGAQPAAGTDEHLAVYQPATDTMWEFWKAQLLSDGWHAGYGGRIIGVSTDPGFYTARRSATGSVLEQPWWGATATSLPLVGGLVTFRDLSRGVIDHAVAMAVPQVRQGVIATPAQRGDGRYTTSTSIPEGARFRLDPTLDVNSLNLPPVARMIAVAAQQYGIIVRDGAGAVAMYGEDPTPSASSAWTTATAGMRPYQVLQGFPWSRLQLLKMSLTTY